MMQSPDEIVTYRTQCIGTIRAIPEPMNSLCARHMLCLSCNNIAARRKSGELTKICSWLEEEVGVVDWGILTVTLPGKRHWIRNASLEDQYRYMTEAATSAKGKEPMRGLLAYLRSQGVEGGMTFLEATYNSKSETWHLHSHMMLVSRQTIGLAMTLEDRCSSCSAELVNCSCWLPGESPMPEHYVSVGGGWSRGLQSKGFGRRYSYDDRDPGAGVGGFVKYCTQLAYLAKPIQFEEKIPKEKHAELKAFFHNSRPRLVRRWGIARQSRDEKERWDAVYNDRQNL